MDKRKFTSEDVCGRCGKKGVYKSIGLCEYIHYVCTKCNSEWCTKFNEWEQIRKPFPKKYEEHIEIKKPVVKRKLNRKTNEKKSRIMTEKQFIKMMKEVSEQLVADGFDPSDCSVCYDVADNLLWEPEITQYIEKRQPQLKKRFDKKIFIAESIPRV
jgi:hypothetical protein